MGGSSAVYSRVPPNRLWFKCTQLNFIYVFSLVSSYPRRRDEAKKLKRPYVPALFSIFEILASDRSKLVVVQLCSMVSNPIFQKTKWYDTENKCGTILHDKITTELQLIESGLSLKFAIWGHLSSPLLSLELSCGVTRHNSKYVKHKVKYNRIIFG